MHEGLLPRERDFLERVRDGRKLRPADDREDAIRQRVRKRGLAAVVKDPKRRWIITDAGRTELKKEPGK